MEKSWIVKNRLLINGMLTVVLTGVTLLSLSLIGVSCATVDLSGTRERRHDPNYGETTDDIRQHFNLGMGRSYDYYSRGAVYLAFGHYDKAIDDFNEAIERDEYDKRNAPTYGMHFIDYFPHRESGVALYFKGESQTNTTLKEQLYNQAIDELEMSLSQEDSSRAKIYLNRARTSLWQVTQADTTPPVVQMKRPIYTNQRKVSFQVTAIDRESHVGEIKISGSDGVESIERPSLFIELAEQEITRVAELTVGPDEKMAVVAITASDLAGNVSDPSRALIIVDTEAPTAAVAIVGESTRSDGRVEATIRARDDFGLRQIQVGGNPNDKVDCNGTMQYSGTIVGVPTDDELVITLTDNAGNTVVAGFPITEVPSRARPVGAPLPETLWTNALASGVAARTLSRLMSPMLLSGLDTPSFGNSIFLWPSVHTQADSLAVSKEPWEDPMKPKFKFQDHVYRPGDKGKEISIESFVCEGVLQNAWPDVNEIRVAGRKIKWEKPRKSNEKPLFSYNLNTANTPLNQTISIKVEAYYEDDPNKPCAEETLRITKVDDGCLDANAVYGLLLLPMQIIPRGDIKISSVPGWEKSILNQIYELAIEKLRALPMGKRIRYDLESNLCLRGQESSKGFRVYDVNQVYRISDVQAWYGLRKDVTIVINNLRSWRKGRRRAGASNINPQEDVDPNHIDLVLYGHVYADNMGVLDMTLRAVDVSDRVELEFLERGNRVLAEVSCMIPNLQRGIRNLALKVAEGLPRVWATVQVDDNDKRSLKINRGTEDGLFRKMELWLYKMDTQRNPRLVKYRREDISIVDPFSSWIECKDAKTCRRLQDDVIITK